MLAKKGRPHVPIPHAGMIFEAYLYRRGLGGGVRLFVVLSVGRKWVELFYPPRLCSIKLLHKEWDTLGFVERKAPIRSIPSFLQGIQERADAFAARGARYNQAAVRKAIELCGGTYVPPNKGEPQED